MEREILGLRERCHDLAESLQGALGKNVSMEMRVSRLEMVADKRPDRTIAFWALAISAVAVAIAAFEVVKK